MTIGWFLMCVIMILLGLLGLNINASRVYEQGKRDLLDKILKDGDINHNVYKKHI